MRWFTLIIAALLVLLACLLPRGQALNLDWLAGAWHDPDHPATRLIFSKPCQQGLTGLLSDEHGVTVFVIAAGGQLSLRSLGPKLTQNAAPVQLPLLSRGPLELHYQHLTLRYLNARIEGSQLILEQDGHVLRLQPD